MESFSRENNFTVHSLFLSSLRSLWFRITFGHRWRRVLSLTLHSNIPFSSPILLLQISYSQNEYRMLAHGQQKRNTAGKKETRLAKRKHVLSMQSFPKPVDTCCCWYSAFSYLSLVFTTSLLLRLCPSASTFTLCELYVIVRRLPLLMLLMTRCTVNCKILVVRFTIKTLFFSTLM